MAQATLTHGRYNRPTPRVRTLAPPRPEIIAFVEALACAAEARDYEASLRRSA